MAPEQFISIYEKLTNVQEVTIYGLRARTVPGQRLRELRVVPTRRGGLNRRRERNCPFDLPLLLFVTPGMPSRGKFTRQIER